jgi:iron complex outermembrane receptor protein
MNGLHVKRMAVGSALLLLKSVAALADTAVSGTESAGAETLNEVIVTGTRQSGLKAADSPAPIQILSADTLQKVAGKPDLIATLAAIVPSLTAQAFGGDQANQTLQAKLRGLSPNDVLVLVNGKRRHTTANLAVLGGPYQGGAGVDLNFIPVEAIDHIEVLTEGAAAQYGSDAIAGVINIILKKGSSGGDLGATYGAYQDGGGITGDVAGSIGFEPVSGGFLNVSAEVRNHGHSNRGAVDPRVVSPTSYPNTNELNAPGYPYLNQIEGDAEYHQKILAFNSGFDLGGDAELYAFGTYGKKDANSFENYRVPSKVSYTDPATGEKVYPYPYGFNPREATEETDYQVTGGVKGSVAGWGWDLASGYGRDFIDIYTLNSANASLYALNGASPTDFYDGLFKASQWASTLDLNHDFDVGLAGPLNVAFGGEYRRETYEIGAGSPASYFGGGAQSYPGFNAPDAGIHSRTNHSVYVDLAAKPIDGLRVDAAGRYEHYSDFGNKVVGKLTARYDFAPEFAVRGTVSTGFRAPTLAEEYYTTTNVSPTSAVVQLAPNSVGAKDLGLGAGLAPETSTNYSIGFVFRPAPNFTATLDLYQIDIKNRVVASGTISAAVNGLVVAPAVTQAIIDNGNSLDPQVVANGQTAVALFTNGVDTQTRGADLVIDYPVDYAFGKVDWSVGATIADTTASNIRTGSAALAGQGLFDLAAISDLTTASPKYVINLGALWTLEKFTVNLRESIYGQSSEYVNDGGATSAAGLPPPGAAPGTAPKAGAAYYYENRIGVTPITSLDLSYQAFDHLKLSVGAVNLFNRYPNKINGALDTAYKSAQFNSAVGQYPSFSPFGIDGGYYYLRANYSF